MSRQFTRDFGLEVARGKISAMTSVNKYGRAHDGIQLTATDIWDRADATPTQQIWVAPTQARTHQIVSTSASDDGAPAGVGARTIRVHGLTGWGAAEVNEDITMNGTANVATSNAYVIINRMEVLTKGTTSVNVGVITATADTDGTVTAQIRVGLGQTHMAIYGIPSTQTAYMGRFWKSMNRTGLANTSVDVAVMCNPEPDVELTNFIVRHNVGLSKNGTSARSVQFWVPKVFPGPCIIKMQAIATSADTDVSAGFDLILVDN